MGAARNHRCAILFTSGQSCMSCAFDRCCGRRGLYCVVRATFVLAAILMIGGEAITPSGAPDASGGLLPHPKAPSPRPRRVDTPPNSTFVSLILEKGVWDVVLPKSATDSEVRALMDHICEEAGETDPQATGAQFAADLASRKHGYDRTNWWFETGGALRVFEKYLAELTVSAAHRPVSVLEVGSYEGGSALWFAEKLLLHPSSTLVCLDTWAGSPSLMGAGIDMSPVEGRFLNNMARAANGERVTAMKGDSMLSLTAMVAAGATSAFDVIYVDAGHTMANALTDSLLSFRLLKVGGFLIVDDMSYPGVAAAMTAFVEALRGENRVELLHSEKQLVLEKTQDDGWATPTSTITKGSTRLRQIMGTTI